MKISFQNIYVSINQNKTQYNYNFRKKETLQSSLLNSQENSRQQTPLSSEESYRKLGESKEREGIEKENSISRLLNLTKEKTQEELSTSKRVYTFGGEKSEEKQEENHERKEYCEQDLDEIEKEENNKSKTKSIVNFDLLILNIA